MHHFTVFFSRIPTRVWHRFRFCANKQQQQQRSYAMDGVIICSPPSVATYHLRPASSIARRCCRLASLACAPQRRLNETPTAARPRRIQMLARRAAERGRATRGSQSSPPDAQTKLKKKNKTSLGTNNPLGLSLLDLITKGSLGDITGSSRNKFEAACREDENTELVTRQQGIDYLVLSSHG